VLVLAVVAAGGDVSRLETRQAASIRAASTTTTRAVTPSCGRPEDAPGVGTPARSGVVPDTRCMDLQLAQDKAEAAGFFRLAAQDATGRGRHPLWDRNWTVTGQTPVSGGPYPKSTRIELDVVKDSEASSCRP